MSSQGVRNALSFDIEDWFHIVGIDALADPAAWPTFESLVDRYTRWILERLAAAGVQATFFVLGWIARQHPGLVAAIAEAGHELGTHSHLHRKVFELTPAAFAEDLRQSIDAIEAAGGKKVLGFRAPSFSIIPGTEWAFDVLHSEGIRYDSSLFPATRGHGGYPCRQEPHEFTGAPSGTAMTELPISVLRVGPLRMPFSGGGYLRLLPAWAIRRGFARFHARHWPVVVYLHPRDFAIDCPRVPMRLHRHFKSYVGLRSAAAKLDMLLERYRFGTCASVLGVS